MVQKACHEVPVQTNVENRLLQYPQALGESEPQTTVATQLHNFSLKATLSNWKTAWNINSSCNVLNLETLMVSDGFCGISAFLHVRPDPKGSPLKLRLVPLTLSQKNVGKPSIFCDSTFSISNWYPKADIFKILKYLWNYCDFFSKSLDVVVGSGFLPLVPNSGHHVPVEGPNSIAKIQETSRSACQNTVK